MNNPTEAFKYQQHQLVSQDPTVGYHTTPINPKAKIINWTVLSAVCLFLLAYTPELIPSQFLVEFYPLFRWWSHLHIYVTLYVCLSVCLWQKKLDSRLRPKILAWNSFSMEQCSTTFA